jgi:glutathione S-transferase
MRMYDLAGADERYRFSPYCWRIKLILAHKGLDCDYVAWRFTEKDRLPAPNQGLVPVLVDGETVVGDSWMIAGYLDERYRQRPVIGSEQARAHCVFLRYWLERSIHPMVSRITVRDTWAGLHPKDQAYFRESREKRFGKPLEEVVADRAQTRARLREVLDPLRATLQELPHLSGQQPALADYLAISTFQWARCVSDFELLEQSDPIYRWREGMLALFDGLGAKAVRNPALVK